MTRASSFKRYDDIISSGVVQKTSLEIRLEIISVGIYIVSNITFERRCHGLNATLIVSFFKLCG